ncbi:Glycerate dehydrogenase [Roseivivax sp. THAF40]|uniref:2-hydroxyacid dehydrogenase n=1 Tax=unclassified Roseivivax TaxID=2639302 RepID=UPI0012695942|nr:MULTISPECIES: D-glycerate dehydrogenase [unclassified Roseivivax]QFS81270.1 Glycerate dehydrogenase [Roseivivax sp. THAF197b]QFT44999.1 Glycerate dehydrogenase [Roseivivax sp. THAF40]
MAKPKILITRGWPAECEARAARDYDATLNRDDTPMNLDQMRAALAEHDAICPTVTDALPADLFGDDLRTRIIGNFGVGYNHIDIAAAKAAGIAVSNTPGVLTDCTADIALTLMLMITRRAGEGERMVRADEWHGWTPTQLIGTKLAGKTLGIVGMGRIGIATARRAQHGFGMKIVYYNRSEVAPERLERLEATRLPSIDAVCEAADMVSLHLPGGGENTGTIGADRLDLIGPDGFLINTARGDVVDESALIAALEAGRIRGAGLDVFAKEPQVPEPLRALDNVVLLPHLGSATAETRAAMGHMVLDNLDAFFAGKPLPDPVE